MIYQKTGIENENRGTGQRNDQLICVIMTLKG